MNETYDFDEGGIEDEYEDIEETQDEQAAMEVMQETLESFLDTATVESVYGEPYESGETTIIPTAEVLALLGFGLGSGYGSGGEGDEQGQGGGSGGGGGGRVLARPVAVVIASPEGVRVEPVFDVTKIALAALTAGGFMAAMLMRMLSPEKALKAMKE
jgi:uncharacterized spore protein YtfJ